MRFWKTRKIWKNGLGSLLWEWPADTPFPQQAAQTVLPDFSCLPESHCGSSLHHIWEDLHVSDNVLQSHVPDTVLLNLLVFIR